jgi:ketosteroid isomerase-like protein
MTAEAEIRALLVEIDEAHKARDMKRLIKTYSPDATLITAVRNFYENFGTYGLSRSSLLTPTLKLP